jgi:hypothetical protein
MVDERVQNSGDFDGNAGTHDNDTDTCQHGPVDRGEVRQLDFLQIIDAHRIGVALPGEEHFNEIGGDTEFLRFPFA